MTTQEILQHLNNEDNIWGKSRKVTRIFLKNGQILLTKFLKKYQPIRFMDENKWIVYSVDNLNNPIEIDGNDIENLESSFNSVELAF